MSKQTVVDKVSVGDLKEIAQANGIDVSGPQFAKNRKLPFIQALLGEETSGDTQKEHSKAQPVSTNKWVAL